MSVRKTIWLLAGAGYALLTHGAVAETQVHLNKTVWGCFDPNVAPTLNNTTNPNHFDPQWIAQTSDQGQCVLISPSSVWAVLSPDYDGLTYVAYRGTSGTPGSFWVPTSSINLASAVQVLPPPVLPPKIDQAPPAATSTSAVPVVAAPPPSATAPPTDLQPAPSTVLTPSAPTASYTSTLSDLQGDFSGGIVALVVLLLCGFFARSMSRRTAAPKAGKNFLKVPLPNLEVAHADHQPAARPVVRSSVGSLPADAASTGREQPVSRDSSFDSPARTSPKPPEAASELVWIAPGMPVVIAGLTISKGSVYVGRGSGSWSEYDASFIDPALPVALDPGSGGVIGHWPTYRNLSPHCRRRYLEWLADGKIAAEIDLGYVFLYFYGLERRLLLETPVAEEAQLIIVEVERLRSIYGRDGSFDVHSRRLLEAAIFMQEIGKENENKFVPDLAGSYGEMPLMLKVALAREVVAGRSLNFDLAAAGLLGLEEFCSVNRVVLTHGLSAFLSVLRPRYETAFPTGFTLRNRKDSHLRLVYNGASSGFQVDLVKRAGLKDLPDPATLTWTKLLALAGPAAEEVKPYAKLLAYYPTRAASLYGLVSCPPAVRDGVARNDRQWLRDLSSPAAVRFGELAEHAIGVATAKWTIRHRRLVKDALLAAGHAMEPDPDGGPEHLEDDTVVQVFRCDDPKRSESLDAAFAAAIYVAIVAKVTGNLIGRIADVWLGELPTRLSLTSDQMVRVRARLNWLAQKKISLTIAKHEMGDVGPDEKQLFAWSATVSAGAAGTMGKAEIAVLEGIYDLLQVPRGSLYAGLHSGIGAAAVTADEPVLVTDEVLEKDHPISPNMPTATIKQKPDRITDIRAETDRVAAMLADIFVEDQPKLEAPSYSAGGFLDGLDVAHAEFLTRLLTRAEWPLEEFESAARQAGLMPSGAMEAINEWAFDNLGEALVEDGDPVVLKRALLPMYQETSAAE